MQYELINPSDPYTFLADTKEVAALTVFCIDAMYGAESEDGNETVPIFPFGGSEKWYKETFHRTVEEGLQENREQVAQAMLSFMFGHFEDRRRCQ